jgi:hypothetical protein
VDARISGSTSRVCGTGCPGRGRRRHPAVPKRRTSEPSGSGCDPRIVARQWNQNLKRRRSVHSARQNVAQSVFWLVRDSPTRASTSRWPAGCSGCPGPSPTGGADDQPRTQARPRACSDRKGASTLPVEAPCRCASIATANRAMVGPAGGCTGSGEKIDHRAQLRDPQLQILGRRRQRRPRPSPLRCPSDC